MSVEEIAKSLTLEQFEHYDVSRFNDNELRLFIKSFHESHPGNKLFVGI